MTQGDWRKIGRNTPNNVSILVHYTSGDIELVAAEDNDYQWKPWRGTILRGIDTPTHWMPLPKPPELKP